MVAREVNTAFTWQGNHLNLTLESSDSKHIILLIKKEIHNYEALKGLSHEIDFKNVVENGQILALIVRAAAGFKIFRSLL
jgi:hypothetical protein